MANTLLLLHCDGSNGSTTFTDASGTTTVTAVGDVAVSTAVSKFGGGSAGFPGAGGYLSVANQSVFNRGSGNFCFELQLQTTESWATIASKAGGTFYGVGNWYLYTQSGDVRFIAIDYAVSTLLDTAGSIAVNDGAMHHIALIRLGNYWYITVDGVVRASSMWSGPLTSTTHPIQIGKDATQSGDGFSGYMDEIRFSDESIYTSFPFTPPTAPFSVAAICTPTGFSSTAFGAPERDTRMIPYWQKGTEFGSPSARYNQLGENVGIAGVSLFGQHSVSQVYVSRTTNAWAGGFSSTAFGQPTRKIDHLAFGISNTRFGTPASDDQWSGAAISVGLNTVFGTPRGNTVSQFYPAVIPTATVFGIPRCSYLCQGTPLWSRSSAFGRPIRKTDVIESVFFSIKTCAESVTVLGR